MKKYCLAIQGKRDDHCNTLVLAMAMTAKLSPNPMLGGRHHHPHHPHHAHHAHHSHHTHHAHLPLSRRSHSLSPGPGQRSRSAKVPVTISDSYVSLGWWMVMSDDEQGYAPAVYLEPVEENNTEKDVYPEDNTNEGMIH